MREEERGERREGDEHAMERKKEPGGEGMKRSGKCVCWSVKLAITLGVISNNYFKLDLRVNVEHWDCKSHVTPVLGRASEVRLRYEERSAGAAISQDGRHLL